MPENKKTSIRKALVVVALVCFLVLAKGFYFTSIFEGPMPREYLAAFVFVGIALVGFQLISLYKYMNQNNESEADDARK